MKQIAAVLLVDVHGRLLLQERDEHAPVAPDVWSFVGGSVEPGESSEQAAYRELAEETGLVLSDGLTLWRSGEVGGTLRPEPVAYTVWIGATEASDADIVVGEGRDIRFVGLEEMATLPFGGIATPLVSEFVASAEYRALAGRAFPDRG